MCQKWRNIYTLLYLLYFQGLSATSQKSFRMSAACKGEKVFLQNIPNTVVLYSTRASHFIFLVFRPCFAWPCWCTSTLCTRGSRCSVWSTWLTAGRVTGCCGWRCSGVGRSPATTFTPAMRRSGGWHSDRGSWRTSPPSSLSSPGTCEFWTLFHFCFFTIMYININRK